MTKATFGQVGPNLRAVQSKTYQVLKFWSFLWPVYYDFLSIKLLKSHNKDLTRGMTKT